TLPINSYTFLSAFFDFTVLYPPSHSISLLHSIFSSFNIFPLHCFCLIIHSHTCSLSFQLLCPSIPSLFSTFLSAFFDFTVLHPPSHSISLLHSIFSPFNIFPLHSLFISLSIATPVHSSFLSFFQLLCPSIPTLFFNFFVSLL